MVAGRHAADVAIAAEFRPCKVIVVTAVKRRGSNTAIKHPLPASQNITKASNALKAPMRYRRSEWVLVEERPSTSITADNRPGQPPAGLGSRQARSKGSRQAWGATS
jgi:hypothetical protein